jgi:hypothetical protein
MFTVHTSSSVVAAAHNRETFPDAVFLAMNLMSQIPSADVYIVDHTTKHRWNAEAINNVAPTLPAWSASHMGGSNA